jgi:hypothetical protein
MQKSLLRQLKRSIGIGSEAELTDILALASQLAKTADPALQDLLNGLGDLLARVDASYQQYERDLELRTRSWNFHPPSSQKAMRSFDCLLPGAIMPFDRCVQPFVT